MTAPRRLRPCLHPGCPVLVESGNCSTHGGPAKAWASKANRQIDPRLRGRANQRARAELFAREPLCRACKAEGRVTLATIRDHVIPLGEGGREREDNVQPLCQTCSDQKTAAESARGVRRS